MGDMFQALMEASSANQMHNGRAALTQRRLYPSSGGFFVVVAQLRLRGHDSTHIRGLRVLYSITVPRVIQVLDSAASHRQHCCSARKA